MKSLVLKAPGQVALDETEVPHPQENELLVMTQATTICTSDLNDIQDNPFHIPLPVVIGHEAAGIVVAVGAAVEGFKPGDRVATHPVHPCGHCTACQSGDRHLCLEMGHFGINLPGTMAGYYRVRQDRARLLPESVSFTTGALVEPVCVCLEALAQARLMPGQRLLIMGDGPFGLIMARLAVCMGLGQAVLAGQIDFRLSYAPDGITPVNVKDQPDPAQTLRQLSGGGGYDAVIMATGSPAAFQQGFACLKPRARLVLFSAMPGDTPVDLFTVHVKELEIVGSCNDQDRLDEAMRRVADPTLKLGALVTHTFPLEDYRQALDLAKNGKDHTLKVAFVFPEQP